MNLSLTEKATRAMAQANAKVIAEHHRQNRPLAVWQSGKVVLIPAPASGTVCETPPDYRSSSR